MYDGPVRHSSELDRVMGLPRRVVAPGQFERLAWEWSPRLLNPAGQREWLRVTQLDPQAMATELARFARPRSEGGEGCPLLMRPIQAQMLYEGFHCRGLFASAAVGVGKTLVSWLLALILGSKRPILLVPASVEQKTHDDFADLARYWQAPRPAPEIVTYEVLGTPQHAFLLCNCRECMPRRPGEPEPPPAGLRPSDVIADESDLLRNPDAARTRRLGRYIANHVADVNSFFMTGTPLRKSIRNFAPQLIWALKWGAPVPLSWVAMQEWCEAIDEGGSRVGMRRLPGALLELAEPGFPKGKELEAARSGFRRRLLETPGVVTSDAQSCDTPLTIRFLKAPDDPLLDEAFHVFRMTQATLDGWDIDDPLSALAYGTQLGCGFYYRWDPRPPQAWLEARRAAAVFVREAVEQSQRSGRPLDTKAQVYRAFPDAEELVAWKEIEPTFVPNSVPTPVSASVLGYAAAWIKANGPALVWVQHNYVGEALSAMSGVPYFGPQGKDAHGRYIMKHSPKSAAILSLDANSRGRNLQAWNRNLVIGPPPAATKWEQGIFGRTHRQGQRHAVHVDVLLSCAENLRAIESAHAEATWCEQTGGQTQKLLIAEYDWTHFPAVELESLPVGHPSRPRWIRPRAGQ